MPAVIIRVPKRDTSRQKLLLDELGVPEEILDNVDTPNEVPVGGEYVFSEEDNNKPEHHQSRPNFSQHFHHLNILT
jgi:hypothetical protein